MYFSPCIDEENQKNRNKIGSKMKTLEAKPFDQNAENWKRKNWLFTLTVLAASASGKNRIGTPALRNHRTVWFVFAAQTLVFCLKLALLVRKGFSSPNDTQSRVKTAKTAVFRHPWQTWKVVWSIAAVHQRPRTPRNWRCSFAFRVFPLTFQWKTACRGDLQTFKDCFL